MKFAVQEDRPCLISGGRAYPVEFTEHHGVNIAVDEGQDTELEGWLTYEEIAAKFGKAEAAVISQETELLGVHVYNLVSPGTKFDRNGMVEGTLYQAQITQFSSVKAEQRGYYFPILLTKTGTTLTTIKDGKIRTQPYPDDSMLLARIPGKDTILKILIDDAELITLHFDRAVFSAEDSPFPPKGEYAVKPFGQKKDFGRFGKWEEYVESLKVTWDGTHGTAAGRLLYYDGSDGRNEKNKGTGNFLPVVLSDWYDEKTVAVFCKNENPQQADDWIITITDTAVPLKIKYNGEVVAEIDLTGVELAQAAKIRTKRKIKKE